MEWVWEAAEHRITVWGSLDDSWGEWFGGMEVCRDAGGPGLSALVGVVRDQAELHGILGRIRDLGLVLVSVERIVTGGDHVPNPSGP